MHNFKSKITQKVLDYFFLNKNAKHYINELANILDIDPGNLFRKLKELELDGILSSESQGNQKYFFLNKKYPLLTEIEKVYNSKFGLIKSFKDRLNDLQGLKSAYIFGSYANGNFSNESDLDILLIGEHSTIAAKRIILPLQKTLKREINIIDLTEKELKNKLNKKDEFLSHIFSNKNIKIL